MYRSTPRSHAYSCRCVKCGRPSDAGAAGPVILLGLILIVIGFWPAMVWHGEGGPSGTAWQWDIHSTIGCCVWWGFWVFGFLCWYAGEKLDKRQKARPPRPVKAPPPVQAPHVPPFPHVSLTCRHPDAVEVDSEYYRNLGQKVIYCCWGPDCESGLPADFRWSCCGGAPGGTPGAGHMYNCPDRKAAAR